MPRSLLSALTTQRDALAVQIITLLENAEFNGQIIDFQTATSLAAQADELLGEVEQLQNGD